MVQYAATSPFPANEPALNPADFTSPSPCYEHKPGKRETPPWPCKSLVEIFLDYTGTGRVPRNASNIIAS